MAAERLTERGMQRLRERVEALEAQLRAVQAQKGEAAELGGNAWHDNAWLEDLERKERTLLHQLSVLRRRFARAHLYEHDPDATGIQPGDTIVARLGDDDVVRVQLRGPGESDPDAGVITIESPLGGALLGHQAGDTITFVVAGRTVTARIEHVERGS